MLRCLLSGEDERGGKGGKGGKRELLTSSTPYFSSSREENSKKEGRKGERGKGGRTSPFLYASESGPVGKELKGKWRGRKGEDVAPNHSILLFLWRQRRERKEIKRKKD